MTMLIAQAADRDGVNLLPLIVVVIVLITAAAVVYRRNRSTK